MPIWLVQLTGDEYDLEHLPNWFPTPAARVNREPDGYYLTSTSFDPATDAGEVRQLAEEMRQYILGAARLSRVDFRILNLGAVIRQYENGKREGFAFASGEIAF